MIKKTIPMLRARVATPKLVKRTLLLTSAAVAAAVVSVTASYAVVSALFPRQATPAALAFTQPDRITLPGMPETRPIVLAAASATQRIDVTPLDGVRGLEDITAVPSIAQIPEPTAPTGTVIITTKSAPDIAVPLPDPALALPDPAPLAASVAPPAPAPAFSTPSLAPEPTEAASPATFAALAAGDAGARTAATLDFTAPAAPATFAVPASVALADPEMPRLRPAPRPDVVPVLLAVAEAPDTAFAESIPGIRPQPRPDVIRVAASAPERAEAEPAARSTGQFFAGGSKACGRTLARQMPRRPANAAGGSAFFASLGGLSGTDRDSRVIGELARGNMPAFLHELQPVTLRGQDARGADTEIVICVTPDYIALGSDRDYVRVPLGLPAAARIAGQFDMTLPTPRMVDAIYAQADVKLNPAPMQAGPQMSSTDYFLRHDATIDGQLGGRGGLIAGQKKDVVMASRMANAPGRVAIYGWHRSGGNPIQPVSTVHGANYADYSHGIRLVSKTAYLNGRAVSLDELLSSSRYAYLLNAEGPLPGPVIRTASR